MLTFFCFRPYFASFVQKFHLARWCYYVVDLPAVYSQRFVSSGFSCCLLKQFLWKTLFYKINAKMIGTVIATAAKTAVLKTKLTKSVKVHCIGISIFAWLLNQTQLAIPCWLGMLSETMLQRFQVSFSRRLWISNKISSE